MSDSSGYMLVISLGEESPIGDAVAMISSPPPVAIPRVGEIVSFELSALRLEVVEVRHDLVRRDAESHVWVITRPLGQLPVETYDELDGWLTQFPAVHVGQHD